MNDEGREEWAEIEIPAAGADAADIADIAGLLVTSVPGARAGVEVRDGSIVFWVPVSEGGDALQEARAAVSALRAGGVAVDPAGVRLRPAAAESEWRDAWMRHFHVTRVASRVVIVPSWEDYLPKPADVLLRLDPGRAFGTGAHASTRLCLIEIDRLSSAHESGASAGRPRVMRFLDLGTGSGILAIAAAKLWPASSGLAIDKDTEAVEVATGNVARNGLAERVRCTATTLEAIEEQFDLVMANIQTDVLESLRESVVRRIAPGGILILSGLLTEEAEEIGREYGRLPGMELLRVHRCTDDPEWSAVVLQHISDTVAGG